MKDEGFLDFILPRPIKHRNALSDTDSYNLLNTDVFRLIFRFSPHHH